MANYEVGSFAVGANGTTTLSLNGSFTPQLIELDIGPRFNTTETVLERSSGWHDLVNATKAVVNIYHDNTLGDRTSETTASSITHWINVSGTYTKIIDGTISNPQPGSFDYTPATGFFNSNYKIRFKVWGA